MRQFNVKVFDDVISGSTTTWLSRQELNATIGQAGAFSVQAVTTGVSGTFASVNVFSEHSSDGQNWIATGNSELANFIFEDGSLLGSYFPYGRPTLAAFVRFKIFLGGDGTQCRLKLYVTGRTCPL